MNDRLFTYDTVNHTSFYSSSYDVSLISFMLPYHVTHRIVSTHRTFVFCKLFSFILTCHSFTSEENITMVSEPCVNKSVKVIFDAMTAHSLTSWCGCSMAM